MRTNVVLRRAGAMALGLSFLSLVGGRPAAAAGGLAVVGEQRNNVGAVVGLNGVLALALSPDGSTLYTAADLGNSVGVFARDAATGTLTFVERLVDNTDGVDGLDRVHGLTVSPDGANLYAAGERDDALAVFRRDAGSGRLTWVEVQRNGVSAVSGLNGVRAVVVSPDGAQVYGAAGGDKAIAAFQRDPATGSLAFLDAYRDGQNGVSGLGGPDAMAFSPDGLFLYVASSSTSAIAVFARDPASGALTWVEHYQHDAFVFDGLDGVKSLVVSPDGGTVYAGGKLDDAVALFRRDPTTGHLTFVGFMRDQVDGIDGLDGVEALALAPDGRTLYAAASTKSSVAAFLADSPAGAFTFLDVQKDGVGTIDGLSGASALAVSPDGVYLYVAGTKANAVTIFSTRCGDGRLDAGEQCDDGNSADGDGCSGGCRKECETAADCDDGDRCTVDLCRGGECAMPECGLRGAICELGRAVPAMRTVPECLPLSRQLGGTIRAHLGLARQAVQLALHPPVKVNKNGKPKKTKKLSPKKLNAEVGRILSAVELKATKLQERGRISDTCLAAVQSSTEALRGEIGVSVLGKGLCAP